MKNNFFKRVGLQFFAEDGSSDGSSDEPSQAAAEEGGAAGEDGGNLSEPNGFEAGFDDVWEQGEGYQDTDGLDGQGKPNEPQGKPSQADTVNGSEAQPKTQDDVVQLPMQNGQTVAVPKSALNALNQAFGGQLAQVLQRGLAPQQVRQVQQPNEAEQIIDKYSKLAGYPNSQSYIQAMKQQLGQFELQREVTSLKKQYPDAPEQALMQLAQQNVNVRHQQADIQKQQTDIQRQYARQQIAAAAQNAQRKQQLDKGAAMVRPYQEFLRQYPDVDIKSLDKNFFELVDNGLHPSAAYERIQAEGYKAQIAAMNKNQQNAGTSIGSMQGQEVESDAFLSGFYL